MNKHPRGMSWQVWLVHLARVGLLALILLLIHRSHARFLAAERARGLDSIPTGTLQRLFPQAERLGSAVASGGREVLGADGALLGWVIQTFPEAEQFLGFSGPTNLLVGFDPDGRIVGMQVLSSRDTHNHVELIEHNGRFLKSLNGLTSEEAASAQVDAVSGATLTSLAMLQGLRERLGHRSGSLKFPDPQLHFREIFPSAAAMEQDANVPELWHVLDEGKNPIGLVLCNSPVADQIVGYQGPTLAFLGATLEGNVIGLLVEKSYDNEPYVGYVRADAWFRDAFQGKTLDQLGAMSWEQAGIEGVSGATMTSQAVVQGLLLAAAKRADAVANQATAKHEQQRLHWRTRTTLGILALGLMMSFTPLRARAWFRRPFQILLIGYLGLVNGDLISLASLLGWAQNGIPWNNALGLVCLTLAACIVPVLTKQNVYCDHICPHGALQQLLPRRYQLRRHPPWLIAGLKWIRPALLVLALVAALAHARFSLANLEPFDAYSWRAAAWPTIAIAVIGLAASLFLPMGYCQYGCPTGTVLGYLRRHARSDRLTRADALALLLLGLALGFGA